MSGRLLEIQNRNLGKKLEIKEKHLCLCLGGESESFISSWRLQVWNLLRDMKIARHEKRNCQRGRQ